MPTFLFAVFIRPIFLAAVCLSFFLQSNCNEENPAPLIAPINFDNDANANLASNNANLQKQTFTPYLPSGNGAFVLYYGANPNDFERIRKANPNFVIVGNFAERKGESLYSKKAAQVRCVLNGQSPTDCEKAEAITPNKTGIKTLYYVPMRCNDDPTLICVQKGLKPNEPLPPEYIEKQIDGVLALGYDGIFFDQTSEPQNDSDNALYRRFADYVHKNGQSKLVIVNPGVSAEKVCRMFDYADIVSVENKWYEPIPVCEGMQIPNWRWLSVQGDAADEKDKKVKPPKKIKEAKSRLTEFRKAGGFWYYTPSDDSQCNHCKLPKFLEELLEEAKKQSVN